MGLTSKSLISGRTSRIFSAPVPLSESAVHETKNLSGTLRKQPCFRQLLRHLLAFFQSCLALAEAAPKRRRALGHLHLAFVDHAYPVGQTLHFVDVV